jgi:hypothetical protein
MTCIVGIEQTGVVYIGGDSAGMDIYYNILSRRDKKVFFVDKTMIMGFTSSFRMGQLLRYSFHPLKKDNKKSEMEYLVTDVIDSIRKVFSEKGFMTKEKESESGGTFLLGYNGHLYYIADDFQVGRSFNGYDACGCGDKYALGSLYSTKKSNLSPKVRVKKALEAATHHSAGVRPPYTILSL